MSARSKWVTWGMMDADSVMRSAIVRRRCDSGVPLDGAPLLESGQRRWRERGGGERRCRRGGGPRRRPPAGADARAAAARTSSSVTRPPGPLGGTARRSTPSSRASLRVAGVAGTGPLRARGGSRRGGRSGGRCGGCDGGASTAAGRELRRSPRPGGAASRPALRIGEGHEHRPDLHRLAGLDVDLLDAPAHRGGDLHLRLVRLHLQQRRVFLDHVAFADEDGDDLRLGEAFAQVGQDELAGHRQRATWARTRGSRGRRRRRAARRAPTPSPARSRGRARRRPPRAGWALRGTGRRPP